jgi:hypothetical protein
MIGIVGDEEQSLPNTKVDTASYRWRRKQNITATKKKHNRTKQQQKVNLKVQG